MTNGRKTTYEERIEIVAFCIANANDYNLTANKYGLMSIFWTQKVKLFYAALLANNSH